MSAVLYCLPLGSSMRDRFAAAVKKKTGEGAVLVLPNSALAEEAERRHGLAVISLDKLAGEILNHNGYKKFKLLNRRSQELVLGQVLEDLAAAGRLSYFEPLAGKKNFVKEMVSFIGQIRRSGASEEEVQRALSAWERQGSLGEKDKATAMIYTAYRMKLAQEDRFDLQGVYSLAAAEMSKEKSSVPYKEIYISDFSFFEPLQLELLRALSFKAQLCIAFCCEKKREEVFAAARDSFAALSGFCSVKFIDPPVEESAGPLAHLRRHLFDSEGEKYEGEDAKEAVSLSEYGSSEAESRFVLTECKKLLLAGTDPRDILVCAKNLDAYSGLRALADEYGLPLALPAVTCLAEQPLASFLLAALGAALGGRKGVQNYFALFESSLGQLVFTADAQALCRLRQEKYFDDTAALREEGRSFLGEEDEAAAALYAFWHDLPRACTVAGLRAEAEKLLTALDLPRRLGALHREGKLSLEFLRPLLMSQEAIRRTLLQAEKDYGECGLAEKKFTPGEMIALCKEVWSEEQLTLDPGQREGIACMEVARCQGQSYPYIFLLGLEEGAFPRSLRQRFYDEQERYELDALGISLPLRAQAYAEDAYAFAQLAAQAQKKLCLSWSREDEAVPSPYVEEVKKLFPALRVGVINGKKAPASFRELWQQGADLQHYLTCEELAAAAADKKRAAGAPLYVGDLSQSDAAAALPKRKTFSASTLEVYAKCPFRYLGEKVWQQEPIEAKEDTAEPADEGSILHAVLAAVAKQLIDDEEELADRPFEEREEKVSALLKEVMAPYSSRSLAFACEEERLSRTLRRFLKFAYEEEERWGQQPWAAEQSFDEKGGTALDLGIIAGQKVSIEGRIDRIDRTEEGLYVTDYKRANTPSDKERTEGKDLQLPIYLLALAQKSKEKVSGGSYLNLKDLKRKGKALFGDSSYKELYKEKRYLAPYDESFAAFEKFFLEKLRTYIENICDGAFEPRPYSGCEKYCPLAGVCRRHLLQGRDEENE